MYWGAGAMEVDGTECAAATAVLLVASGPTPLTIACNDSDDGYIEGSTVMPDSWNGGVVTITMQVGQIAASTGGFDVDFEVTCVSTGDDFVAFADANLVAADVTLVADDDAIQVTTGDITVNGTTCAGGDYLAWRGDVDAGGTATSSETLVVIVGVLMEYTSTIGD